MKKNLLFASLVISALSVNSQIIINTGDMPVAGQTFYTVSDTNVTSYGNAGTNQTWNFAAWGDHKRDTSAFYTPASLPGFSFFPTATMVTGDSSGAVFMKNSSSSLDILGFYADFGMGASPIEFTPSQKFLSFPSTYLTSYNGVSKYNLQFYIGDFGIDSMKIKANIIYSSSIDAWGAITTPTDVNVNSLRQKFTEYRYDTTYMQPTGQPWMMQPPSQGYPNPSIDTTITYRWFSNTKKWPLAEIITDGNNMVTNASYLLSTQVGVKEQSKTNSNVSVFPNPATDKINITGIEEESFLVIFDVNGKLIENSRLTKNNTSIYTSDFENGIYFYQITSFSGKTIGKGKFIVAK